MQTFTMNNGLKIPAIAFGTWRLPDGPETVQQILTAIAQGYRSIDTAAHYGNEKSVGTAVRQSNVKREDLFVATKLRNTQRGYDTTLKDFDRAITDMGLDYIDLYMIHWPASAGFYDNWEQINADTWRAMERLQNEGVVRSLGVSNFTQRYLETLEKTAHIAPAVNQISLHPGVFQEQKSLIEYCFTKNIVLSAYSPLGAGAVLSSDLVQTLAEKYNRSSAQICLRWCLQHKVIPLPKSSTVERMRQNLDIFDFDLSKEDMNAIDHMPNLGKEVRDPDQTNFD